MPKGIPKNGINKGWFKKGIPLPIDVRKKISEALHRRRQRLGYINSPETRQNISQSKLGSKNPMYGKIPWDKGLSICLSPKTVFKKGAIPWNKGKKHLQIIGPKHPNWRGGVTPLRNKIRSSIPYVTWRRAVFKRDGYTCQSCGAKSQKGKRVVLHAHHIKQFAFYPELRFSIENGLTLCDKCHKAVEVAR